MDVFVNETSYQRSALSNQLESNSKIKTPFSPNSLKTGRREMITASLGRCYALRNLPAIRRADLSPQPPLPGERGRKPGHRERITVPPFPPGRGIGGRSGGGGERVDGRG